VIGGSSGGGGHLKLFTFLDELLLLHAEPISALFLSLAAAVRGVLQRVAVVVGEYDVRGVVVELKDGSGRWHVNVIVEFAHQLQPKSFHFFFFLFGILISNEIVFDCFFLNNYIRFFSFFARVKIIKHYMFTARSNYKSPRIFDACRYISFSFLFYM
jgi:hypothetical protein